MEIGHENGSEGGNDSENGNGNDIDRGGWQVGSSPDHDFQFTVVGGQVTAVQEVAGSRTHDLHIPHDATFSLGAGTVTETLAGSQETTVLQFTADTANPSLFDLTSITKTIATPTASEDGFSFTIANGAVTGEQHVETEDGKTSTETVQISPAAAFTVSAGTITETLVKGAEVETIQFVQPAGSTLYAVASITKDFIETESATTSLSVEPFERAEFTIDGTGAVTLAQKVHADGTLTTIAPDSHVSFTQLAPGFVQETVTHGSHTNFEVFFAGTNSNGIYTAVAEGAGATADLVGLQAQLAQLPTSVGWII